VILFHSSIRYFLKQNCDVAGTSLVKVLGKVAETVEEQLLELFHHKSKKIIILAGPTGAGKTMISLDLAERIGGEIISCDSMQVYRGMDIGTAKASLEERKRIKHYLIDICDVQEPFNVKNFFDEAIAACKEIFSRGKVPIFVGGTGFYIHAFLYGPPLGPGCDPQVRERLIEEESHFGIELLYEKLLTLDLEYAKTVSQSDRHKILRALEIMEISGKRVSDFSWRERPKLSFFDQRCWFLFWPRPILYERLEKRIDGMLAQGLLEEVVRLDRLGIRNNKTAAQAIGYRQTLDFLDTAQTAQDYEEYVKKLKQASRNLAKRQFTWFRKEPDFRWLDLSKHSKEEVLDIIKDDYNSSSTTLDGGT
jgi:tRNA dimethylallyltransferase